MYECGTLNLKTFFMCIYFNDVFYLFTVMSDNAFKDRQYERATGFRKATIGVSVAGILLTMIIVIVVLATQFTRVQQPT